MRKDRAGALCLTASPARLILLRATRGDWRTEAVLQFAGDTSGVGEGIAGGTILGLDAAAGERLFTVRTVGPTQCTCVRNFISIYHPLPQASRNHIILAPDAPAAERWKDQGDNVSGVTAREDDVQSIVALPCGQDTIGTISAPFINLVFE